MHWHGMWVMRHQQAPCQKILGLLLAVARMPAKKALACSLRAPTKEALGAGLALSPLAPYAPRASADESLAAKWFSGSRHLLCQESLSQSPALARIPVSRVTRFATSPRALCHSRLLCNYQEQVCHSQTLRLSKTHATSVPTTHPLLIRIISSDSPVRVVNS